jgi:lysophospholipase L1-like esterase
MIGACGSAASAQIPSPPTTRPATDGQLRIDWEVKNRFRLFREEKDFQHHVAAYRGDGVLAAEARLANASGGFGWARDMVRHLCVDVAGRITEFCVRDGRRESYLAPVDHRITAVVANAPTDAECAWTFDDGDQSPQQARDGCDKEMTLWVRYGRTTRATVEITLADQSTQYASADIAVRDLLIAGLGDSVASGEGNPDRPIKLSPEGFCFRRTMGGASRDYFRPGRAGFHGDRACALGPDAPKLDAEWSRLGAGWLSPGCHRSLYSYQLRTALELAVEYPHIAVTFIPLGCSGASIEQGMIGEQRAAGAGQIAELRAALASARRTQPDRTLDLVLLTVGANDIRFSALVANVIIEPGAERVLFERAGRIASVEDAERSLALDLPAHFAKLRAALKPLVGGDLGRVVYVTYGHPALHDGGKPCPGGRDGFDIHPAFAVDGDRLRQTSDFVIDKFFPRLKALALCEAGILCDQPASDRMAFVDAHQAAFADHGFCAHAESDPVFDRECFSTTGESFQENPAEAATDPLTCEREATEFRSYASRSRWVRTANDSYFSAMTYPQGLSGLVQPSDIHDAIWGITSALYGGAVHPTAEGHAAMADATLPSVRTLLGLPPPNEP